MTKESQAKNELNDPMVATLLEHDVARFTSRTLLSASSVMVATIEAQQVVLTTTINVICNQLDECKSMDDLANVITKLREAAQPKENNDQDDDGESGTVQSAGH